MAGDSSSCSGHARDEAQGMEVLRARLLTQEMALRALAENVDYRFQSLEGHFDDWILWRLVLTWVGMKTRGDQEKMLLIASMSTGLYLRVTINNLSIVMIQKRRRTFCRPISSL